LRTAAAISEAGEYDEKRPKVQRIDHVPESFLASREERAIELCDCLIDIASALFGISSKELRQIGPGRACLEVTRIRQVAMYVAHVTLHLTMKEVGMGFGRDRTTVLHACHLIEDLRDDIEFDRMVVMTERIAAAAFRSRPELVR